MISWPLSVADAGFPNHNHKVLFWPSFSKSCMKMKDELDPEGGGGRESLAAPIESANVSGSTSILIVTEHITSKTQYKK